MDDTLIKFISSLNFFLRIFFERLRTPYRIKKKFFFINVQFQWTISGIFFFY